MKKCPECNVQVQTTLNVCPLCGGPLTTISEPDSHEIPLYPKLTTPQKSIRRFPFLAKLFLMISLGVSAVCILVNILIGGMPWAIIAVCSILLSWLLIGLPLLSDLNINHMLILQMLGTSIYLYVVDRLTGNHGWAMNYAIPLLYVSCALTVSLFVIIFRVFWREYLITLIAMAAIGIIPALFLILHLVSITWPCWAAILAALTLISGMIIFARSKTSSEFQRRMNI